MLPCWFEQVSMVSPEAYQGMMQQNANRLEHIMRSCITGNNLTAHRDTGGFSDPTFKLLNEVWQVSGSATLQRTHVHTHKLHRIPPHTQKRNRTLTLSRDAKIPPIRRATEQLGWDLEQRQTHTRTQGCLDTNTQSHTCTEGSTAGSHLRVSDVERKHLEGREED